MLSRLVTDFAENSAVIIAGDFNAWALEWGSLKKTAREQTLYAALIYYSTKG